MKLAVAALALAVVIGCGGPQKGGNPDDALVVFDCPIKDASVWVNGRYIRPVGDLKAGIAIAPGKPHFIEVKHDRYHTFYLELTLAPRQRKQVVVRLAEVLP